ncbi:MAG: hypothetical protein MH204_10140 [Fimbriimonadaceae bacterium]|nr:hypothetical protein [Fimbriimonadaceae bacterium]
MTALFCLGLAGLAAGTVQQTSAPVILIAQQRATDVGEDEEVFALRIGPALADAIRESGRARPIVFSEEDPSFKAVWPNLLVPDDPLNEDIELGAAAVGARYILVFQADRRTSGLRTESTLYEVGRRGPIWRSPKRTAPQVIMEVNGRPDWQSAGLVIGRNWVEDWVRGPWRSLARLPAEQVNPTMVSRPTTDRRPDVAAARGDEAIDAAEALLNQGRLSEGVVYLRDAVDANPADSARRILLVETLSRLGMGRQAAEEGRRAARFAASRPELWLSSARAWLQADEPAEADLDLREALVRGVDSPELQRILGDIRLIQGRLTEARDSYSLALESTDSPAVRIGLTLVFSGLGNPRAAESILEPLNREGRVLTVPEYESFLDLSRPQVERLKRGITRLLPEARTAANLERVAAEVRDLAALADGLALLHRAIRPPGKFAGSHDSRALAQILMLQATKELLAGASGENPEALQDVVLSLAESLRVFQEADRQLTDERRAADPKAP